MSVWVGFARLGSSRGAKAGPACHALFARLCHGGSTAGPGRGGKDPRNPDCFGARQGYPCAVENGYTWQDMRGQPSYRLPGPDNLGWWVGVASLLAVLLHVVLFFVLGHIKVALGFQEALELRTAPVNVEQVEVSQQPWDEPPPTDEVEPPPKDASSLLEELDLIEMMPKDTEVDIRPDIKVPEFALKLEQPAMSGALEGSAAEPVPGPRIEAEMAEMGRLDQSLQTAAEGQVIVDPGAAVSDLLDPDKFNEELLKKGAEGKSDSGLMKGFTSLDDMLNLPGSDLLDKKAMIGSDLLFEYNSDQLRESAKVSLMKVVLLIDRNPGLFCWLEGHTDLFGGEDFNLDLSRRRAAAVKSYLVDSMQMPPDRLVVKGFGWGQPIIPGGSVDQQALNRRVEIKMRKERAGDDAVLVRPKRAIPVPEARPAVPPAAVPPPRETPPPKAQPVEEAPPAAVPRAEPVPEPPAVPKAQPVEEAPPVAIPRAEPVPQ